MDAPKSELAELRQTVHRLVIKGILPKNEPLVVASPFDDLLSHDRSRPQSRDTVTDRRLMRSLDKLPS